MPLDVPPIISVSTRTLLEWCGQYKRKKTRIWAGCSLFYGSTWILLDENLERAMRIELTASAWEAEVLPLYDAREGRYSKR